MSQVYMTRQKRPQQAQAKTGIPAGPSPAFLEEAPPVQLQSSLDAAQNVEPHAGKELHLDEQMSARMQAQFGIRMDQVELRESSQAADMDAKAFAKGNVVQFAPGQFQPDTQAGQQLIQHELAHVAQQARGGIQADVPGFNINADEGLEHQADLGGVSAGGGAPVSLSGISADTAPVQGAFGGIKRWFQRVKRSYNAGRRMRQRDEEVKQMVQAHEAERDEMVASMKQAGYSDEEIQAQLMFQRVNRSDALSEQFHDGENRMFNSPEMEALEDTSEFGNRYSKLGRGTFFKSAERKRFLRDEHLRNDLVADRAYTAQADQAAQLMAAQMAAKQDDYTSHGMHSAVSSMRDSFTQSINEKSVGQAVDSGQRFVYMRGNHKELSPYFSMLKKAGKGTNQAMYQRISSGLESSPESRYSNSTGEERAAYDNRALEDFDAYLAMASQDENMIDALRQSADLYSGLGEYDAASNPGGMVGGREEALHRGFNDMILRSFFPAMTANPDALSDADRRKQIVDRTSAMMKLQTSALSQSLGTEREYSKQELALRGKLQKFYQDNGLMPAAAPAAVKAEEEETPAPEHLSFQQKRKLFGG